jgi:hypothetical protein
MASHAADGGEEHAAARGVAGRKRRSRPGGVQRPEIRHEGAVGFRAASGDLRHEGAGFEVRWIVNEPVERLGRKSRADAGEGYFTATRQTFLPTGGRRVARDAIQFIEQQQAAIEGWRGRLIADMKTIEGGDDGMRPRHANDGGQARCAQEASFRSNNVTAGHGWEWAAVPFRQEIQILPILEFMAGDFRGGHGARCRDGVAVTGPMGTSGSTFSRSRLDVCWLG